MTSPTTPYDRDLYSWAAEQAELLRLRRFDQVDWPNVIEEIADLGKSEYRSLAAALEQLTLHLLKWQFQPERRSRSWTLTIDEQRTQVEKILEDSPGLKHRQEEALARGYKYGRRGAARETGLDLGTFPEFCPYTWADLINPDFLPG